jgi:hypothetical protein
MKSTREEVQLANDPSFRLYAAARPGARRSWSTRLSLRSMALLSLKGLRNAFGVELPTGRGCVGFAGRRLRRGAPSPVPGGMPRAAWRLSRASVCCEAWMTLPAPTPGALRFLVCGNREASSP